jgi:hypothetical protein
VQTKDGIIPFLVTREKLTKADPGIIAWMLISANISSGFIYFKILFYDWFIEELKDEFDPGS